jgi:hypothetical protein
MTTDSLSRQSFGTRPRFDFAIRRKVFVAYSHLDQVEANRFVQTFGGTGGVFIPKALGVSDRDDFINSTNTQYVMQKIRERYIQDSTVTVALIGTCTHSRRYIDWEIKASLQQGPDNLPNGLIAIQLLSSSSGADLPPRLLGNWRQDHLNCYARYWRYPQSEAQLREWIEDGFEARRTRSIWIQNPQDIMKKNAVCSVHKFTH